MTQSHSTGADEQAVSPALRRRLQQCYEHATRLMSREAYDFDYAHTMLVECVARDPGNIVYLDAFLENLRRKYNNNKRGALLSIGGKGPFKKAVAKEDWQQAVRLGPEALKSNPWDVSILRALATSCGALGYHETELRYLKNALEVRPQDAEVNRHCARSLARVGQFDQAIVCWQRVDDLRRGDAEAQSNIAELQIEKTQHRLGVASHDRKSLVQKRTTQASPPTQPAQSHPSAVSGERKAIPLTLRQQLEQAVALHPADLEPYHQLADLHLADGRLGEAAWVLEKGLAASGNALAFQERLEDVEVLRRRQQLQIAEQRAPGDSSQQAAQLAEQLRSGLHRYELEMYHRRAERYPDNWELHFQLAMRLKWLGNYREAIKSFESATRQPRRHAVAIFEIAECLQRLKKYAKSVELYRQAAALSSGSGQPEINKLACYRAAVLESALGNARAAEELLAGVVQADAHFKDAASRLDKLRQMRHKD